MKIRNKIVQIIALVGIVCFGYSCSDEFFTEQPGNRITPDQHFNSQAELNSSINGTYIPLQNAYANLLLLDGLRSDMLDVTEKSDVYMRNINDQILTVDNPYIDGSDFYKTIINCNEIIKNIDQVYIKDPSEKVQEPFLRKGEVYNIKAMCYFNVVRLFGKAALISDNMSSFEPTQNFLTKRDMIDTMINQLKPYVFTDPKLEEMKFDFGPNTKMLIGEMYLENGRYDSAAYYLKLGCESFKNEIGLYKLSTNEREKWKEMFYKDKRGPEIVDLIEYAQKKDQYNAFTGWTLNYNVKPTQVLCNLYRNQVQSSKGKLGDVYRGVGVTVDTLPGTTDQIYVSKYSFNLTEPYSAYIVTQRTADIHLLLAEAFNHIGDTAKALALVNKGIKSILPTPRGYSRWSNNIGVRARVLLKPKSVNKALTGDALINAIDDIIIEERMLELAYEGKRWFDLVRIAERRGDPSYLASKVAAKFSDPTKSAEIYNKLLNPAIWYLPSK